MEVVAVVELSSVLSDLRRQFGIAPGAEVPRRLVAEAITRHLSEQTVPASDSDGTSGNTPDTGSQDRPEDPGS